MIEHSGAVESVQGDTVCVKITSSSACGSCQARQACGLAETQEKIVSVKTPDAIQFTPGENVMVGIRRHAGGVAVALAYLGALAVLLTVLVAGILLMGWSEGLTALVALLSVVGYYGVLWLLRRTIEHKIQITITKT